MAWGLWGGRATLHMVLRSTLNARARSEYSSESFDSNTPGCGKRAGQHGTIVLTPLPAVSKCTRIITHQGGRCRLQSGSRSRRVLHGVCV